MSLSHPQYGEHAYCDPRRGIHRWSVTGTAVWIETVENAVEEGLSPDEIVSSTSFLPPHSLPHVAGIHRIYREYLVRIGRPVAS